MSLFTPVVVDQDICKACGTCYELFSCPAIGKSPDGKAYIVEDLCNGNGSCIQVCPIGAIFHPRRPLPPQRTQTECE